MLTTLKGRLRDTLRRREFDKAYRALDAAKKPHDVQYTAESVASVCASLRAAGYDLHDYRIDTAGYRYYMTRANYDQYPYYQHGRQFNFIEKSLEHFIAADLMQLNARDRYIDIGNDGSPTPEIYADLFGCEPWRQDLIFEPGVHGNVIGGDAGAMPVENAFASAMALHCTFEHFEGDADTRFIRECARVLRPGGRACILPLYLHTEYAIQTDLSCVDPAQLPFEPDAVHYCHYGYNNRHGRFYDADHFRSRIVANLGPLQMRLFHVVNPGDVDPGCYVTFVAMLEKPAS